MKNFTSRLTKKTYRSFDGCGVDVAVNRADDLDKKIIKHLQEKELARVLDLGSGEGGQSLRMVQVGAFVTAIDLYDLSNEFTQLKRRENIEDERLEFIQGDIIDLSKLIKDRSYTDVCLQRTLHYLTYKQALDLLSYLNKLISDKLFISVTGIDSAVGEGYCGREIRIEDRFCRLDNKTAETFSIHKPICLYRKDEFIHLLETAGFKIEECWQSAFGNLKAVCRSH